MKPGDIVRLKSGGPRMTIDTDRENEGVWYTSWFLDGVLQAGAWPEVMLRKCWLGWL